MMSALFAMSRRPPGGPSTECVDTGAHLGGQIAFVGLVLGSLEGPGALVRISPLWGTEERLQFGAVQQGGSAITRICLHSELSRAYQAVQLGLADLVLECRVSDIEIFCFSLGIFHVRLNVAWQRSRFNMYRCVVLGPGLNS